MRRMQRIILGWDRCDTLILNTVLAISVFAACVLATNAMRTAPANDPESPDSWVILNNVPGWRADQHHIYTQVHGASMLPAGGSYGPIGAVRNGTGVDERDIHACYWWRDGSVHTIDPDTDADGMVWWPQFVTDIDPWSGRIQVEWVADVWAQTRVDAEPHWPAEYTGAKWRTTWLEIPQIAQPADFNGDGTIDTQDFNAFLNAWNGERE